MNSLLAYVAKCRSTGTAVAVHWHCYGDHYSGCHYHHLRAILQKAERKGGSEIIARKSVCILFSQLLCIVIVSS